VLRPYYLRRPMPWRSRTFTSTVKPPRHLFFFSQSHPIPVSFNPFSVIMHSIKSAFRKLHARKVKLSILTKYTEALQEATSPSPPRLRIALATIYAYRGSQAIEPSRRRDRRYNYPSRSQTHAFTRASRPIHPALLGPKD
jgi:hypothetical protein